MSKKRTSFPNMDMAWVYDTNDRVYTEGRCGIHITQNQRPSASNNIGELARAAWRGSSVLLTTLRR